MSIKIGQRLLDEIDEAITTEPDPARRERVRSNLEDLLDAILDLHLAAVP